MTDPADVWAVLLEWCDLLAAASVEELAQATWEGDDDESHARRFLIACERERRGA